MKVKKPPLFNPVCNGGIGLSALMASRLYQCKTLIAIDINKPDEDITIDGDFGPGTKGLVREFQQEELNGGDGRVGPNTLTGMVEYLEN